MFRAGREPQSLQCLPAKLSGRGLWASVPTSALGSCSPAPGLLCQGKQGREEVGMSQGAGLGVSQRTRSGLGLERWERKEDTMNRKVGSKGPSGEK